MQTISASVPNSIAKDQLIEQFASYVVRIAKQIKRSLSQNVETDDLIGYGMTGLIEAAERFDPKMGANFSTFSYYRIKGAIYDGLRAMGSLSRTEYRKHIMNERACAYMENECAKAKSGSTKTAVNELNGLAKKAERIATIYLTSLSNEMINCVQDESIPLVDERMARLQLYEKMRTAIGKLSKSDQEIIRSYYFDELSLEEVGKRLGLSKSWTCRKHARAIEKLSDLLFNMLREKNPRVKAT